jgi:hypothetical protein
LGNCFEGNQDKKKHLQRFPDLQKTKYICAGQTNNLRSCMILNSEIKNTWKNNKGKDEKKILENLFQSITGP